MHDEARVTEMRKNLESRLVVRAGVAWSGVDVIGSVILLSTTCGEPEDRSAFTLEVTHWAEWSMHDEADAPMRVSFNVSQASTRMIGEGSAAQQAVNLLDRFEASSIPCWYTGRSVAVGYMAPGCDWREMEPNRLCATRAFLYTQLVAARAQIAVDRFAGDPFSLKSFNALLNRYDGLVRAAQKTNIATGGYGGM